MFYEIEVKTHVRVPPSRFKDNTKESILKSLNEQFMTYVSKDLGAVLGVTELIEIGDGIIIAGDSAAYYDTRFKILTYKPEMQEVVLGKVMDIREFGAFMDIGALDGMIHISQTMDDFVSFSKSNVLTGKESKKVLKVGDKCRARIIAVSFKDLANPKIGLTMRQGNLGNLNWVDEEGKKEKKVKGGKK
jgi:DNA-directed RNA polymerase subunit E'